MPKFNLLSSNAKLDKCQKIGWLSLGLQMAPYDIGGPNVCKFASKGCAAACLFSAGRGAFKPVQDARIRRKEMFFNNKDGFVNLLIEDIKKAIKYASKHGLKLCIRPNVLSDIPWHKVKVGGQNIFERFPTVQFMDYTKDVQKCIDNDVANYHLTFSRSEENDAECQKLMIERPDVNIAVVFNDPPETWKGRKVIDGDDHDARFLDPAGCIVGLKAKGKARHDTSGFVVHSQ